MARRCSWSRGSALLSLIVLQALVAPACSARGLGSDFVTTAAAPVTQEDSSVGICATLVTIHGYECHEFEVTTADGYILSVQRIPGGRLGGDGSSGGGVGAKTPVILQHGLVVDGMTWLLNPPEQNLPFVLADKGFDVWIANGRGTYFSKKHTTLSPLFPEYWNWTWVELAMNDLPAVVDFVFTQTNQKTHYVGHSQGTLIMLASLSEGKLLDKLRSAALLCPVAFLDHITTLLGAALARSFVGEIYRVYGIAEYNPTGVIGTEFIRNLCKDPAIDCSDLIAAITGKNCCLNSSTLDIFLKSEPQSSSTKNMVHLSQNVRDGILAKYDYENPLINIQHYGAATPPVYDLANIPRDFPLFISYGGQDSLADVQDVQNLLDTLKLHDVDKLQTQLVNNYAHVDFIMGTTAKDVVYESMVSFFNRQ